MVLLILMRHGESLWNKANLFTGWVDVPLSVKGIEEALQGGEKIAHLPIDEVYISALSRAEMTALLALSKHHSKKTPVIIHDEGGLMEEWGKIYSDKSLKEIIPVFRAEELNERMYGELQGKNKQEMREIYGEEKVQMWRRSFDIAPPNGESLKMTSQRTLPYFDEVILKSLRSGKNIFVSAHGNSLRSIIMELDELDEDQVVSLEIPTGEPILYTYEDGHFKKIGLNDLPR